MSRITTTATTAVATVYYLSHVNKRSEDRVLREVIEQCVRMSLLQYLCAYSAILCGQSVGRSVDSPVYH